MNPIRQNQIMSPQQQQRARRKLRQAVWAQIHQVHRVHWKQVSPKFLRRMAYWARVYAKWSNKYGVQSSFMPRKPRGKRALAFAAFLAREQKWQSMTLAQQQAAVTASSLEE